MWTNWGVLSQNLDNVCKDLDRSMDHSWRALALKRQYVFISKYIEAICEHIQMCGDRQSVNISKGLETDSPKPLSWILEWWWHIPVGQPEWTSGSHSWPLQAGCWSSWHMSLWQQATNWASLPTCHSLTELCTCHQIRQCLKCCYICLFFICPNCRL